MNCAPVVVGSGADYSDSRVDENFFDTLPDMFLANIPDAPRCASPPDGQTLEFPEPGNSVERNNVGQDVLVAPVVGNGAHCYAPLADGGGGGGSNGWSASQAAADSPISASPSTTTSTIPVTPIKASVPSPSSYTTSTSSTAFQSLPVLTTLVSACTSCDQPGSITCINATHFGICDINYCAIPQPVAAGTKCEDGVIVHQEAQKEKRDNLVGSNGRGGIVVRESNGRGRWRMRDMRKRN